MRNKNFTLLFNAITATLEEQLNSQGYTLGRKKDKLEKIHKSIQTLGYAKMISFSQEDKLNEKLFKMCEKESKKIEE